MQIMDNLNGSASLGIEQANHLDTNTHSLPPHERETLMAQAMNKIVEAERMEEKRRRRLHKIAKMVGEFCVISCLILTIAFPVEI